MMTSAMIISATDRVLENGALNTGTPRWFAVARRTWFVPMQNAPIDRSRRPALTTASVTCVLLRMPSTWTSAIRSTSSASGSAPFTVSTWKPSSANASAATW